MRTFQVLTIATHIVTACITGASEAYHDWSGEAADARKFLILYNYNIYI